MQGVKALGAITFSALIDEKADEVLNSLAWRKYVTIVSLYGFYGGIYVQVNALLHSMLGKAHDCVSLTERVRNSSFCVLPQSFGC